MDPDVTTITTARAVPDGTTRTHMRSCADHPLAARLTPWELENLEDAWVRRLELSIRDDPERMDRDAFVCGYVACLEQHHVYSAFRKDDGTERSEPASTSGAES